MEQCVLVLGKNYSTPLGIIRALGQAGFRVELLIVGEESSRSILEASRYLSRVYSVQERNENQIISVLLNEVDTGAFDYQLFPTDDFTASLIDRHRQQLQDRYRMPYIIGDTVTRWMDKSVQSALAREIGFPTAREWVIRLDTEELSLPEDLVYPCFVKPLISADGGKVGITECASPEQLRQRCALLRRRNRALLVQQKLNILTEYTIDGIADDQRVEIPAVIRKTRIARHNRGVTLTGVLVSNEETAESIRLIKAYLQRIRYVGIFDFELLQTADGIYFGELNLRCGGPCYAYVLGGANLPALTARLLYGEGLQPVESITLGTEFINPKVAWEDYSHGFFSKQELTGLFRQIPASLLSDPADPKPEECFNAVMPARYEKLRGQNRFSRVRRALASLLGRK